MLKCLRPHLARLNILLRVGKDMAKVRRLDSSWLILSLKAFILATNCMQTVKMYFFIINFLGLFFFFFFEAGINLSVYKLTKIFFSA